MTLTVDELAEDIAGIFEHTRWAWGLALAGFPERLPDQAEIAGKIEELLGQMVEPGVSPARQRILSGGRIVLAVGNPPPYDRDVRVLLDIGELPLPGSGRAAAGTGRAGCASHGRRAGATAATPEPSGNTSSAPGSASASRAENGQPGPTQT